MKKIYVTIAEFIENGGEIAIGRKVYEQSQDGQWYMSSFNMPYEDYKFSSLAKENYYVQIDCQPIYK